jgi:hypothetical protein
MEAKWPFLILLLFFVGLTGYLMSRLERTKIMRQWDKRRCDFTVMMAARFFKPDTDPRSPATFASDNFNFCLKEYSDGFLSILMAPVSWLMGKQANLASGSMAVMNQVRNIIKRVTDAFMSYLSSYTKKFQSSILELRRIFIYLRMGVQRMIAIAMSTIYMGMTLFRGMISGIQTIIRVILIICAIMIAVIIILWFILLPIIPFILTTLTAVVALVGALSVVMSSSLASQAQSQKGGFCFAENTVIRVQRKEEQDAFLSIPIKEIQIGDKLEDDSIVTMVMEVTSENVEWYEINGIWVSGDHRIQSETGEWWFVREDPRAHSRSMPSSPIERVYCLNTTTRQIPLRDRDGTLYYFRDWEEFDETDKEGHCLWNKYVLQLLNPNDTVYQNENHTDDEHSSQDIPLVGGGVEVNTTTGWRPITEISIGDIIMNHDGTEQKVLGIVRGMPSMSSMPSMHSTSTQWIQGGYVWDILYKKWMSVSSEECPLDAMGWNLITETGEWIARTERGITRRRDFTEVGHKAIRSLYHLVSTRLRSNMSSFSSLYSAQ